MTPLVTIETDLGQGLPGETMAVFVHGAPCRIERARAAVVSALLAVRAEIESETVPRPDLAVRPCGCKNAS